LTCSIQPEHHCRGRAHVELLGIKRRRLDRLRSGAYFASVECNSNHNRIFLAPESVFVIAVETTSSRST